MHNNGPCFSSIVQKLLEFNSGPVRVKDKSGMTPLHLACWREHFKVVQVHKNLLNADELCELCETQSDDGSTPLHLACASGNIDIVKLLTESNANLTATNKCDERPLHIAVKSRRISIVQFLLQKKEKVPIEHKSIDGLTPLHYAAKGDHIELIELLRKK